MNLVILLTACINPGNLDFVGRKGLKNRLSDYLKAAKFYSQLNFPIVFIDNSNFVSDEIKSILCVNVKNEYHTYLSKESVKGKGHGELEIINYGYEYSDLMKHSDIIFKISGRHIISNILDIISNTSDLENVHYCNLTRNLSWADTRIMILSKFFHYSYLNPKCISSLDESNGVFFERIYARSINQWLSDGKKIKLLPHYPYYDAINGQNNKVIYFNFYKKLKYSIYFKVKHWIFKQVV